MVAQKSTSSILASELFKELSGQGKIEPGTATPVACVGVGIAIRAGAPRPKSRLDSDALRIISRPLTRSASPILRAARPAALNAAAAIERLGMTAELKSWIKVYLPGTFPLATGARRGRSLATQTSEIMQVGRRFSRRCAAVGTAELDDIRGRRADLTRRIRRSPEGSSMISSRQAPSRRLRRWEWSPRIR